MPTSNYTAITFAPVQGFIEKSRKLRDLYGSSYILSHLADRTCQAALCHGLEVISPALIDVAKGTPNQLIIKGDFPEQEAREIFQQAWGKIVDRCRCWVERNVPGEYYWSKEWNQWRNYAWEFFWVQGESAKDVRGKLNELKRSRAWTGINWKGESSTLSGADAIAYPRMGLFTPKPPTKQKGEMVAERPVDRFYEQQKTEAINFYKLLSDRNLTGTVIEPSEQLSIPELIKRLVTITEVADDIGIQAIERVYPSFKVLNRLENNEKTGWFQGDGDAFGKYLKFLAQDQSDPDESSKKFSLAMRNWAKDSFTNWVEGRKEGRVIYAGGDDFLGIFYKIPEITINEEYQVEKLALTAKECLQRFYEFPKVWNSHGHAVTNSHKDGVTVSVGFVWAYPGVPQRDVLQHCKEAEKSAKSQGRDRLAIRILFNSGNHLEWSCPWDYLKKIFTGYCDRSGGQNWTHIYNDVAVLESRHAFDDQGAIAQALWEIYFPALAHNLNSEEQLNFDNPQFLWNQEDTDTKLRKSSGILGDEESPSQHFNKWFINLAKVGFHLYV